MAIRSYITKIKNMLTASSSSGYYNNTIFTRDRFDLATGELIPEHNLTDYLLILTVISFLFVKSIK
jgi:hypothetical protein